MSTSTSRVIICYSVLAIFMFMGIIAKEQEVPSDYDESYLETVQNEANRTHSRLGRQGTLRARRFYNILTPKNHSEDGRELGIECKQITFTSRGKMEEALTPFKLILTLEKSVKLTPGSTILCYIGSWANFRPETREFRPLKHVDGSYCTHAIYAFARLCDNGTLCPSETGNSNLDEDNLSYRGVGALKNKWPNLRVGVSIGGWAEGSERFSLLAASRWSREQFVNALIETLRIYNMTAVELAWISPTIRLGGKPYDRENYVDLIRDVSQKIRPLGYHLGVAIKVDDGKVDAYYDTVAMARYADWLHIQAFDFHGHWEEFTGINAPLRWSPGDTSNVEYWMKHIARRAGPERLLLGMPLFGRSWRMVPSPVPEGPGARALGAATYDGLVSYKELCVKLQTERNPSWKIHWNNVSMTPWTIRGDKDYVSFDNEESLVAKVDFVRKMNVAGVAVFTVDQDDYEGECGRGKFPLMRAIKEAIDARVAS